MPNLLSRSIFPSLILGLLACLHLACSAEYNAKLVIVQCLDQDGNTLPAGVTVTVDGVSEIWNGESLEFPFNVEGDVRQVSVRAGAGGSYVFNSRALYDVTPGKEVQISLHFFKPYTITIEAIGQQMARLPDADVYVNDHHLGRTDDRGRFTWRIDQPNTPVGIARADARFNFRLERDGESIEADPVILQASQYSYATEAFLEQEGLIAQGPLIQPQTPTRISTPTQTPTPSRTPTRTPTQTPTRPPRQTTPPPNTQPTETVETPPETPKTTLQLGDENLAGGNLEMARRLYNQISQGDPDYKRSRQRLGQIALDEQNYQDAVNAYEDILEADPSEYAAYNNLAAVYLRTESYDQALQNLNKVQSLIHLVPRDRRKETDLTVRYQKADIQYKRFLNEGDPITKREQGLLAMSTLRSFIDQVGSNAGFVQKRQEMEDKMEDVRRWVRQNQ